MKLTELEALDTEPQNTHFINSSALDEVLKLMDFMFRLKKQRQKKKKLNR